MPGDTVIPRNALAVINGEYYAFVEKGDAGEDADLFERRKLEIEQENNDVVVVKKGLKAGERVVSNGSPDPLADLRGPEHRRHRPAASDAVSDPGRRERPDAPDRPFDDRWGFDPAPGRV